MGPNKRNSQSVETSDRRAPHQPNVAATKSHMKSVAAFLLDMFEKSPGLRGTDDKKKNPDSRSSHPHVTSYFSVNSKAPSLSSYLPGGCVRVGLAAAAGNAKEASRSTEGVCLSTAHAFHTGTVLMRCVGLCLT